MYKRLVIGSVKGKFEQVFAKVSQVNAKHGPFDALLCVGQFFAQDAQDQDLDRVVKGEIKSKK